MEPVAITGGGPVERARSTWLRLNQCTGPGAQDPQVRLADGVGQGERDQVGAYPDVEVGTGVGEREVDGQRTRYVLCLPVLDRLDLAAGQRQPVGRQVLEHEDRQVE